MAPTVPLAALPSIRRRLLWTQALVTAVFTAVTAGMVWSVTGHEIEELMDLELRRSGEVIGRVVAEVPLDSWAGFGLATAAVAPSEMAWQLITADGEALLTRSSQAPEAPLTQRPSERPEESADGQWRYIALALQTDPPHLLVVAHSTAERDEGQRKAVGLTVLAAVSLGLLSALLLGWRIQRELQPLQRLSERVRRLDPLAPEPMAPHDPHARRRELRPIEDALAELAQRLAQRLRRERAFSAHAAHALRTPVAGLDAQLAIALKEAPEALKPRLQRARDATGRLSRVMQALLALFRSGMEPQRQTLRVADAIGPLLPAGLALATEGEPTLSADPDLLAAALLNLIDNAQKHGATQLALAVHTAPGAQSLILRDNGHGCPPDRLNVLRQALEAASGDPAPHQTQSPLGLGLVLADLVARAHGGRLRLPEPDETGGSGFSVELAWPGSPHG